MQFDSDNFEFRLNKTLAPLYVLASDEYLLVQEGTDLIRSKTRKAGFSERQVFSVDREFNWEDLFAADNAISLFGERKLIELRIPTGRLGREGSLALQEYISRLSLDNVTLITLPQLDWTMQKSAWVTLLKEQAVYIEIPSVGVKKLKKWIISRLMRQNQFADEDAIAFLMEHVEGNLLAAWQEIQKLGLLYPEGRLTEDHVRSVVLDVARYNVFQLTEAILGNDPVRFIHMMDGLKNEGAPLPLLHWIFADEVRTLLRCRQMIDNGIRDVAAAVKACRVRFPHQYAVGGAMHYLDSTKLMLAAKQVADADRLIKGLDSKFGYTDAWNALIEIGISLMNPSHIRC